MEHFVSKYAVLLKRTDLRLHLAGVNSSKDSYDGIDTISAEAGNLIKIFNSYSSASGVGASNKLMTVQLLDLKSQDPVWENLYECPQSHLRKVNEDLWPYVIAISSMQNRLRVIQSVEQCKQIVYLHVNDVVHVSGDLFSQGHTGYDCIIRYIGPVEELSSVGYYFGLELLHLDNGYSPQSEENFFSTNYMECDPKLSIFTTADWIQPISGEVKSKFSARDVISDTIQKARTAFNNCTNVPTKTSLRRPGSMQKYNNKSQTKQPTAQFYGDHLTCDNFHEKNSIQQEPGHNTLVLKTGDVMENKTLQTLSSHSCQKGKLRPQKDNTETLIQDETTSQVPIENPNASQSSVQLITFESEDLKQATENYKKNLTGQHASVAAAANIPSTGILKYNRSTIKDNSVKPLAIKSLEGRDIVVIDKADIKESTKNENNIIVVDKQRQPQEVDLVDLLGGNWPNNAGDTALVLNKAQDQKQFDGTGGSISNSSVSSYNYQKSDRNKSSNLLSHLGTKGIQKDAHWMKTSETCSQTTANNSIGIATSASLVNANSNSMGVSVRTLEEIEGGSLSNMLPTGLGVGSMVEVLVGEKYFYGVIRWAGVPPDSQSVMVGVELEDEQDYKQLQTTDGSYNGVSLFKCQEGRALFIRPKYCSKDRRFEDVDALNTSKFNAKQQTDTKMFGQVECPSVPGAVAPLKIFNLEELEEICGKFKGIQGHHNSCYLDATLFSMFTFTHVFDSLLFRPSEPDDISHYDEVQKVLREEIVNPLRKNVFVRADRVMKLRQLLDKLSSVSGLTSEEKDPEEFLNSLLTQIMRVEPFLKLSSGQDAYFYQLFVEKDERLSFPSVQQLFEQSFHSSDIKLKEVPSCLIIQMPRFGKNFKMYPRILPSQVLDVTDIIEDSPRQCSVCGKHAEYECRDCFGILQGSVGLESTAFCGNCLKTVHQHTKRSNHKSKKISVPQDFKIMAEHMVVPRLYMELFAVVCIETSHYVAFVKAGSGPDAPWCFFDSMADRKGEQNGYNIPEMISVPDLPLWLSEDGARTVNETFSNDKMLPEHAKRLFCDAYMCMYQSTDVMMYR